MNFKLPILITIAICCIISFSANATIISISTSGGFILKDTGEYIELDASIDPNQTNDGLEVHDGIQWGQAGNYSRFLWNSFAVDINAVNTNYMLSSLQFLNQGNGVLNASISNKYTFTSSTTGGISAGLGSNFVIDNFTADFGNEWEINTSTTSYSYNIDNPNPMPDLLTFDIPFYIDSKSYKLTLFSSFNQDGSIEHQSANVNTNLNGSSTLYRFARITDLSAPVTDVPEPSTLAIFGLGLLIFASRKFNLKLK